MSMTPVVQSTYSLEAGHDELLVVNHRLPSTRRLLVVRNGEVGLQPHFALGSECIRDLRVSLAGGSGERFIA